MKQVSQHPTWRTRCSNEAGTALPIALIVLVLMTALSLAFASLGTTEPTVARNQVLAAQALALAESGIERAIWALSNPAASGIATTGSAGTPYNGDTTFVVNGLGTFRITVQVGALSNERIITATAETSGGTVSKKTIRAVVMQFPWSNVTPPSAIAVLGRLDIGGNADVDSRANHCAAAPSTGTISTGDTYRTGAATDVYGPGDNTPNQTTDMLANQSSSTITMKLSADDFTILRSLAQAMGRYYRGAKTFNGVGSGDDELPVGGGIVFVDTTTGADFTNATPSGQEGDVTINGNLTWNGWIVVAGQIHVTGTVDLTGAVYAQNDFLFTGNGSIRGTVVAENRGTNPQTSVSSSLTGSSAITYDCPAVRTGGGTIGTGWFLKPGTFTEQPAS